MLSTVQFAGDLYLELTGVAPQMSASGAIDAKLMYGVPRSRASWATGGRTPPGHIWEAVDREQHQ